MEASVLMQKMRWRLWFAFRDSKYPEFSTVITSKKRGTQVNPNYDKINEFCLEKWGKKIGDMTQEELAKYINLVKKWKD